jgi:transposase, IS5 family
LSRLPSTPKQSQNKEEKSLVVEENAMPADWSPSKRRQKDLDARWAKKHGKSYLGYKLAANVGKRCKLIRKIKISSASKHDTLHFEDVLDPANTSRDIYADRGYVNHQFEERLASEGYRMQQRRNRRIASPHARVEHVFAGMAQLGGKMLRLIGPARATLHLNWKATAYNLRRPCYLKEAKISAF